MLDIEYQDATLSVLTARCTCIGSLIYKQYYIVYIQYFALTVPGGQRCTCVFTIYILVRLLLRRATVNKYNQSSPSTNTTNPRPPPIQPILALHQYNQSSPSSNINCYIGIRKELDDSAFLRTQSYITEICYFEFL